MRFRDADGHLSDVTGELLRDDAHRVTVQPDDAPARDVEPGRVVARRRIPPRPVRPTSAAEKVQRLAGRGWPGLEQERIGGWLLRAGHGYSHRANSALPLGDPGMPAEQALARTVAFYEGRGLAPTLQVPHQDRPGWLDAGWDRILPSLLMVADLRDLELDPTASPTVSDGTGDEWWSLQTDDSPLARRVITACPAWYGLLTADGSPVAAGRLSRVENWVGLTSVTVAAHRRGEGYGRAVVTGLLAFAREQGSRFAYLQVEQKNEPAVNLYRSMGFAPHHHYAYWEKRP